MREIENTIVRLICEETELVELNEETNFFDVGIDSLTFIKCIVRIEEYFGIEFPDIDLNPDKLNTVAQMARRVMEIESLRD